jgi:hypothetical protein
MRRPLQAHALLLATIPFWAGCWSTTCTSIGSPDAEAWLDQHVGHRTTITFRNPQTPQLTGSLSRSLETDPTARLSRDEIRLKSGAGDRLVPLESVRGVRSERHVRGAFDGVMIGAAAGALFGVATLWSRSDPEGCTFSCERGKRLSIGIPFIGVTGALLGGLLGGLIGHQDILKF